MPLYLPPSGSLAYKVEELGSLSQSIFPSDDLSSFLSVSHASSPVKIACFLSGSPANEGSNLPYLRASGSAAMS